MRTNKTRLAVVSGATLALIVASTAAVAAHPNNDRERGFGDGKGPIQRGIGKGMLGDRGGILGDRGGFIGGLRGGLGPMAGGLDDLERREVTIQTSDGTSVQRLEQGTVDSASDTGLTFSLANGESVTVDIDADTNAVTLSEQEVTSRRGFTRTRLAPTQIEVADIAVGAEVFVWSDSDDGSSFMAQRIMVQPEAALEEMASEDAAAGDAADESAAAPVADA